MVPTTSGIVSQKSLQIFYRLRLHQLRARGDFPLSALKAEDGDAAETHQHQLREPSK